MDAPLNLAHQQGRKADCLLKNGKFEEAIMCHNRAAEFILEAMQQTKVKTALESLQLQHAHHLKQTEQLFDRQRRAQLLQIKQNKLQHSHQTTQTHLQGPVVQANFGDQSNSFQTTPMDQNETSPLDDDSIYKTLTEHDSLLGLLIRRRQNLDCNKSFHSGVPVERIHYSNEGTKSIQKNKKEQETKDLHGQNEDLRKHVQQLLKEVDELKKDKKRLEDRVRENPSAKLFTDVGGSEPELIPDLPPLEMPQFDFDILEYESKRSADNSADSIAEKPS